MRSPCKLATLSQRLTDPQHLAAISSRLEEPALKQHRSPSDVVNVAVVGFHGRGKDHYRAFARMPNVRVAALCDADERLFPAAVAEVEKLAGYRPATEYDIRRLLERKDIWQDCSERI